ncbi:MAG TPA: hypothetical protein VGP65_13820 [Candidatus Angelobacter sp.]|jgi:hypothetical protein|nr:hypothetical protein [Candidatus Angelobacter sp.]
MRVDPVFENVFKKIYGKPCWRVSPGYGSFLTLQFGEPHLEIKEPRTVKRGVSAKVRRLLESRTVLIKGQWHLWIYCCSWKVRSKGKLIGESSSKPSIQRAADFLDGQKLLRFSIAARQSRCRFQFDLGGVLETWPYDDHGQQWFFFDSPVHKILILRADHYYSYAFDRPDLANWKPVQIR